MSEREEELARLQEMKPTQWRYVNWHEGGGGEVQRVHDVYVLFSIPIFGGQPQYMATYSKKELPKLISDAYSWT